VLCICNSYPMVFNFQQFQQISIKVFLLFWLNLLWIILCQTPVICTVFFQTISTHKIVHSSSCERLYGNKSNRFGKFYYHMEVNWGSSRVSSPSNYLLLLSYEYFGQKLGFSASPVWGDTLVSLLGYWVSYILYTGGSSSWHGCNSVNTQSLPIDAYDCIPSSCGGLQHPPVRIPDKNGIWDKSRLSVMKLMLFINVSSKGFFCLQVLLQFMSAIVVLNSEHYRVGEREVRVKL
jgi:hypothetical protein